MTACAAAPAIRLVPATVPLLDALVGAPEEFAARIGSPVPEGWPTFPEALDFTRAVLVANPSTAWAMQFFLDRDTGLLVGSGGYAGDPVERTVEIGYEIAPAFRGRGLGTAAARALVDGALRTGEVDTVVAHTLAHENPSTGVLRAMGFTRVAEIDHAEDGPVWRWRWRPAPPPRLPS